MWPHVLVVARRGLAVTAYHHVDVVHIAIAVVVELCKVYFGVIGLGLLHGLNHCGLGIDVVAGAAIVGSIVGALMVERVGPEHGEVWHKLPHGVVAVVVLYRACAATDAIVVLVEPTVEVVGRKVELAVAVLYQHYQVLAFLGLARGGVNLAVGHAGRQNLLDGERTAACGEAAQPLGVLGANGAQGADKLALVGRAHIGIGGTARGYAACAFGRIGLHVLEKAVLVALY